MPAIDYNTNIPAAGNVPLQDVARMQTNTNSINTFVGIDHYAFADTSAGWHKQITFAGKNTPSAPTDPSSVLYTASGTASTKADLKFVNQNATFLISSLRAMGVFTTTSSGGSGSISLDMGFNVSNTINYSSGAYTLTFTANALSGSIVVVSAMSNSSTNTVSSWSYSPGSLVLTMSATTPNAKVSFLVFQV